MENKTSPSGYDMETYIALARQEKSPLKTEDVEKLLSQPGKRHFSITNPTFLIITCMSISTILIALLWLYQVHSPAQREQTHLPPALSFSSASPVQAPSPEPARKTEQSKDHAAFHESPPLKAPLTVLPDKPALPEAAMPAPAAAPVTPLPVPDKPEEQATTTDPDKPRYPISLTGIHLIELSAAELRNLNISTGKNEICINEMGLCFSMKGTRIEDNPLGKSNDSMMPELVTDDLGMYWRCSSFDKDKIAAKFSKELEGKSPAVRDSMIYDYAQKEIIKNINTLIPVLVRSGQAYSKDDSINHRWRPDVICWYAANEKIFDKLPERLREEVRRNFYQVTGIEKAQQGNCEYFEVCRNTLTSFRNIRLFPNPATQNVTLNIQLEEAREVRIGLYDIGGRELKTLANTTQLIKGDNTLRFDVSDLTPGMYLIGIVSDRGEVAYQRMIKQ